MLSFTIGRLGDDIGPPTPSIVRMPTLPVLPSVQTTAIPRPPQFMTAPAPGVPGQPPPSSPGVGPGPSSVAPPPVYPEATPPPNVLPVVAANAPACPATKNCWWWLIGGVAIGIFAGATGAVLATKKKRLAV